MVLLRNLRFPGMRWLMAGMALNFLVMDANGGLMPVSPETLIHGGREHVLARNTDQALSKKNVILLEEATRLALLSDRLVVPGQRGAFSVGDVLIAVGLVVALRAAGGPTTSPARAEFARSVGPWVGQAGGGVTDETDPPRCHRSGSTRSSRCAC